MALALRSLLRYARFLRADVLVAAAMLASLAVGTGLGLLAPYLTGSMVGVICAAWIQGGHGGVPDATCQGRGASASGAHGLAAAGGHPLHALPLLALAMIGAGVGTGVFGFLRGWLSEFLAQRSMFRARSAIYEHLESQSFDFFDSNETGQLLSRATGDVEVLRRFISRAGPGSLAAMVQFVGTAAILLRMDPSLALLALAIAPVYAWIILRMSTLMRPASWAVQQELANITTVLQETISSIRVVKAFVRSEYEEERFSRVNRAYMDRSMDVAGLQARYQPIMNQLPTLGTVFILGYGGLQVIGGHLSLGMFVAFNSYVITLLGPLRMIGFVVTMGSQAAASAERIFEILDSGGRVKQPPDATAVPRLRGEVRLENVWARYAKSDQWVLQGVDLAVAAGESVALVGMTGAGKSTLVQLIPRFYDPERGRVLVDEHDVRRLDLRGLRSQIGFVLQDPFLFSATLEENIRYGRPEASRETVEAAARAAHIADFIASLPEGYQTMVGERGLGLSGGQKQRIAIARALVMDPRILVLDDATSSVDAENEHLIWDALRRLMAGRTSFIIAHRLASVMFASRIVVLEGGRVAAVGTHEALLESSELYRTIYELQLAPAERTAVSRGGLLA